MNHRILILPLAAAVITGLVLWRMDRQPQRVDSPAAQAAVRRLAPRFELYDQHSQLVKFERYLGRTRLLLLFTADTPAAEHALARQLLEHHAEIENAGVQIVVVGTATPFANREAEKQLGTAFPFPVLTDVDRTSPVPAPTHRRWGLIDGETREVQSALFVIDRDGTVAWAQTAPQPVADPARTIAEIAQGNFSLSVER
jgi:peroxiredoxin